MDVGIVLRLTKMERRIIKTIQFRKSGQVKYKKKLTLQVGAPPGPDGRVEVHLVDLGSNSLVPTAVLRTGMHSQLSQVSKTEDENQNNSATPKSIYHNRSYFINSIIFHQFLFHN